MKISKSLLISGSLTMMLVGCGGGGGSSSSPTSNSLTGTFIDAPVKGLYYKTATQEGYTNEKGEFSYKDGERVEFKIGNLSFGSSNVSTLMTPYTMGGDTDFTNPSDKATIIAMLLQNFDSDRSDTSMLDVSKLKDVDLSDISLSDSLVDIATKISNMLADNTFVTNYLDINNSNFVDSTTARNTLRNFVVQNSFKYDKKITQAYLDGKTFYNLEDADDNDANTWKLYKMVFNNGVMTRNLWDGSSYGSNEDMNYTIKDGKVDFGGAVTLTITSSDDDKISLSVDSSSGTDNEYLYFDEDRSKKALLGETKKYTQKFLDLFGTMYSLYQDHDNNNAWTVTTIKFSNGKVYEDEGSFTDNPTYTDHTYTITAAGAIKENSNGDEWLNIIENVTSSYIEGCTLELTESSCSSDSKSYLYFNKALAETKLSELQSN